MRTKEIILSCPRGQVKKWRYDAICEGKDSQGLVGMFWLPDMLRTAQAPSMTWASYVINTPCKVNGIRRHISRRISGMGQRLE